MHVAEEEHAAGNAENRDDLGDGEQGLHAPAEHDAGAVDEREHRDHTDRDQLARTELEGEVRAEERRGVREPRRSQRVDIGGKHRHRRAIGGDNRPAEHEAIAGEEEGRDIAIGRPQVHVLPARCRQHSAKFRKAQRAEHRDQPRRRPRREHQGRRADGLRHLGGLQEHPGTDGDADDQRSGVQECQDTARLQSG